MSDDDLIALGKSIAGQRAAQMREQAKRNGATADQFGTEGCEGVAGMPRNGWEFEPPPDLDRDVTDERYGARVDDDPGPPEPPADPGPMMPVLADKLLTRSALRDLPDPKPLIDNVLDQGTTALLYGKWGTAKTFVALDWAASVATRRKWQGRHVETTTSALRRRRGRVRVQRPIAGVGERVGRPASATMT